MRTLSLPLLRWLLVFIASFHLVMGFALMTSLPFQQMAVHLYGATVVWNAQFIYLVRILGSFAFVFGVLAAIAVYDPLRHQGIVWGFVVLFLLRDLHRLIFAEEIQRAFSLAAKTNVWTNLFFLAQTVGLVALLWTANLENPH